MWFKKKENSPNAERMFKNSPIFADVIIIAHS